ncbi:MAG: CDP-diacylglycerol--serine O-phosphatidyltransferase [Candidatus Thermoplasmatota archaeon]
MRWLANVTLADLFTLMNGILGFVAITYIVDRRIPYASVLICAAILMDGLDGYFARRAGMRRSIGRYLDSISDSVSFCIAPALLLYTLYYDPEKGRAWTSSQNALAVLSAVAFASCGILRLARFTAKHHSKDYFVGLPTPAAAFGVLSLTYLFGGISLFEPYLATLSGIAIALLMVSEIPYPKLRGMLVPFGALAVLLGAITPLVPGLPALSPLPLALFLCYAIGGPIYEKRCRSG